MALKLWQLKFEQFSQDILKLGTEKKDNPLRFYCSKIFRTFLNLNLH